MNKNNFRLQRTSLAITLALASLSGAQIAQAGSGWGDSADAAGKSIKVPTYYANSPSGSLPDTDCFDVAPPSAGDFTSAIAQPAQTKKAKDNVLCDSGTALRKFVDTLPGLNAANNLGNSIPVAVPDTATYPGSDYYEIGVVEYTQKMHSDLAKATTLRGYVQLSATGTVALKNLDGSPVLLPNGDPAKAVANPSYLGPVISATSGRAVRIKMTNLLPAGAQGDIHLPVDETITGAGVGPDGVTKYQKNRVEIHLHGGDTPWISDGTPHQWILPAADETALIKAGHPEMARGVSAKNVPDMPDPGPGAVTYYFPNNQSGRLMFYHDHTLGMTRLNVYAGVAAGYLISDAVGVGENHPALAPLLPTTQIPLVIQDKTFVAKNIAMQDAKWDTTIAQEGDLWYPHVYETNQDPLSYDGTNPVGRWDWGSWFWPVFASTYNLPTGEMNKANTPAPVNGTAKTTSMVSSVSTTPEAYMDTALVNGTAYPSLTVEPKSYRFRILNAANDRFMNLGLYLAADKNSTDANNPLNSANTLVCDGSTKKISAPTDTDPNATATVPVVPTGDCTEVKMVNFDASYHVTNTPSPDAAHVDGTSNSPIGFPTVGGVAGTGWGAQVSGLFPQGAPDPATAGPHIVQIGNEGGLLAQPLDIPSTPLNFEYNKRSVTVLNVLERGLYLGPAERADVLVDFTNYAGKTLILYNDAPAPDPASDPRIDYFTGESDQTGAGGAANTLPGYGPNTRTVMQIIVSDKAKDPSPAVDFGKLSAALPQAFASSQPTPVVPQPEFNTAYDPATYVSPTVTVNGVTSPTVQYSAPTARNNSRIYTGVVYLGAYKGVSFTSPEAITYFPAPTCATTAACTTAIAAQQAKANNGLVTAPAGSAVSVYVQSKAIQELFDPAYGRMNATLGVELPFTSALTQTTIPLGYVDPITETVADGETQFWKITHNGVDAHPVHFHLVNVQIINRVGWDGTIKAPYGDEFGWKDTVKMNPLEDVVLAVRAKKPILNGATAANGTVIPSNAFGLPVSSRLMDPSQPAGSLIGFTQVDPMTGNPATVANALQSYGWEYVWHCHILGHEENDFMRPVKFDVTEAKAALPTKLAATAGANGGVVVSWADNATTEYAYKVEHGIPTTTTTTTTKKGKTTTTTTTSTVWTDLTASLPVTQQAIGVAPLANATTFTDTSAPTTAGTTYQYRVTSIGANGNGVATISYTVPTPPPVAPSNLTTALNATGNGIVLSWTDNSTNENNFTVYRSVNGVPSTTPLATVPSKTTAATGGTVTYTDTTGLVAGSTYTYYVVANTTATPASSSVPSNTATYAIPAVVVATPGTPVATATGTTIALSWADTSNNENTFTVWSSVNGAAATQIGSVTRNATQATAIGGVPVPFSTTGVAGNTYTFYVIANKTSAFAGVSAQSGVSNTVTIATAPIAPTNVSITGIVRPTATSTTDTATVSWINATTGATPTSFNIQCASNTTFTGTSLKTATATATASSATVTGIVRSTAGTTTYCRIQAVNNGVPSLWSSASPAVLAK
jgi:FtsP/CotA-like multicopper oxidase with cupredoxin domain